MRKAFDPRVFQLGYVALGVTDMQRSRAHYVDVMGLAETDRDRDAAYLSVGAAHHDIVLRPADEKSFLHLGYQLRVDTDLASFAREVGDFGLPAQRNSDSQPGISDLVEVEAPGSNLFQFYAETSAAGPGFPNQGIAPLRLGHVAVVTPEAAKLRRFYEDFLGFHYTDDIGGVATFMTCNRDHHVVNVVGLPDSRLHHIAFELADNGDHMKAADVLGSSGQPTLWGPSRHHAGHNLASYHYDPDRVMIELYTQMDVYVPALGANEPRPWHSETPMRPKSWKPEQMTFWETAYGFDLVAA